MITKKRVATALLIFTCIFIQACGRKLPVQDSCGFVQNSSLRRISWKDQELIKLYVHQSVPAQYHDAIDIAVMHWNEVLGKPLLQLELVGVSGPNTPQKDNYSIIYMMDTWEDDKTTEQARTTVYWSGSRIYEADIRINNRNFDFFTGTESESGRVHFESLMVHELGHALGLAHTNEDGSVMKPFLASGDLRETPGEMDEDAIACEYL